jgi:hypothetical protein
MALVDLSKRSAVRRAIDEFDRLGREASARAGRVSACGVHGEQNRRRACPSAIGHLTSTKEPNLSRWTCEVKRMISGSGLSPITVTRLPKIGQGSVYFRQHGRLTKLHRNSTRF